MKRSLRISFLIVLCTLLGVTGVHAANVVIIESQSFNPAHVMDQNWANVATTMGHTVSVLPQTALDTGTFIPGCDLLIVSSGVIPLSTTRRNTIRSAYSFGVPVYLQCESNPTFDTNQTWIDLVQDAVGTFTWNGTTSGTLSPLRVSGTLSTTPNTVNTVTGFIDGAYGVGSQEVETNLHFQDQEYGWYVRPIVTGAITLAATTTDQDWVMTNSDPQLMQNYIANLIPYNASELQVRCSVNSPVTIPAAGGNFTYQAYAFNTAPTAIVFDAWSQIQLQNGNFVGPFVFAPGLTIQGFTTSTTQNINQNVPGFMPPGTYYVYVSGGTWPSVRRNMDAIRFVKL